MLELDFSTHDFFQLPPICLLLVLAETISKKEPIHDFLYLGDLHEMVVLLGY